MLVNDLNSALADLDEGFEVCFPDGKELLSVTVIDKKVYLSDELPASCPKCGAECEEDYICTWVWLD